MTEPPKLSAFERSFFFPAKSFAVHLAIVLPIAGLFAGALGGYCLWISSLLGSRSVPRTLPRLIGETPLQSPDSWQLVGFILVAVAGTIAIVGAIGGERMRHNESNGKMLATFATTLAIVVFVAAYWTAPPPILRWLFVVLAVHMAIDLYLLTRHADSQPDQAVR